MKVGLQRSATVQLADPKACQVQGSDRSGIARCEHGYAGPLPRGVTAVRASVSGAAGQQIVSVEITMSNGRYKPRLNSLIYDNPARRVLIGLYSDYKKDASGDAARVVTLEKKLDPGHDHRGWELRIVDAKGNVLAGQPPLTKR